MKDFLRKILEVIEYIAMFLVGYYGIKYCFVAGPIYFGNPWGPVIAVAIAGLFIFHILKKEGVIKI
jgi:hypothetical protein